MNKCNAGYKAINIEPNGQVTPCCIISPMHGNSLNVTPTEDYFSQSLWQTIQNEGADSSYCNYCNTQEKVGSYSVRETINSITSDTKAPSLEYLNLNLSNFCNLQCRSCDSSRSYLIGNSNSFVPHVKTIPTSFIKSLIEKNSETIKHISIQGGEPLLHKELPDLILWIKKVVPAASISLVTNLTYLPTWLPSFIENCLIHRIKISVDATEARAEFIRSGLIWDKFDKNLRSLKKISPLNYIKISTTLSVFSIYDVNNVFHYLSSLGLDRVDMNVVCFPEGLDIKNLNETNKEDLKSRTWLRFSDTINKRLCETASENVIEKFLNSFSTDEKLRSKQLFPDFWSNLNI